MFSRVSAGFSLIELLVVVAIIGILAAVGIVGYQGYIDAAKKETALANGNLAARAIEQDFLSLSNGLTGTTELDNKLVIDGVTLSTDVTSASSCFKYAESVKQYLNGRWKNAFEAGDDYAVNLHFSHSTTGSDTALKPGQLGLQCANVCSSTRGNFYIDSCSCTADNGCELFDFTKGDYDTFIGNSDCYPTETAACTYEEGDAPKDAYDYITHAATQNRIADGRAVWTGSASSAAASLRVLVGTHSLSNDNKTISATHLATCDTIDFSALVIIDGSTTHQ
jgi:prepilin-type N-terminal cleavage/methylation domain-containing protein